MRKLNILKALINIYYYVMIIAFIAGFITIPLLLFTKQSYKISPFGHQVDIGALSGVKSILIVIVLGLVLYFYFRAIHLMRITIKELEEGHYFTDGVIANFKKMGTFFLISGIGFFLFNIILKLLLESRLSISLDSTLFFFVIVGLFFMFLSEVFKVAKDAKEENDLTI